MKEFKVTIGWSKEQPFINVVFKGNRFRYSNGKSIGLNIKAKDDPELLRNAFKIKLLEGWEPERRQYHNSIYASEVTSPLIVDLLKMKAESTQQGQYSYHHKRDCLWVFNNWMRFAKDSKLMELRRDNWHVKHLKQFLDSNTKWSNRTKRNITTTFKFLAKDLGLDCDLKFSQSKSKLHRKVSNLPEILNDIKAFNSNLYLLCMITYGCLLRPHQEIRLLTWSEVDLERGIISLDGARNKTGRNRVVPIPGFVKKEIEMIDRSKSEFLFGTGKGPYNRDYFNTLWSRYKNQSEFDLTNVTLYSFRHTGAINVFEKTGSIQKVKEVMGHSNIQVSLIYLRGIEVSSLSVQDMPDLIL
jgi:integrase